MRHLDEGTIHAWLDGALDAADAARAEAHVAQCGECAARVAEARGLIAASSRILAALDDVPAGVIVPAGVTAPSFRGAPAPRPRASWLRGVSYAAAAVLLVGVTATIIERGAHRGVMDAEGPMRAAAADRVESATQSAPAVDSAPRELAGPAAPPPPARSPVRSPAVAAPRAPSARASESRALADVGTSPATGRAGFAGARSEATSADRIAAGAPADRPRDARMMAERQTPPSPKLRPQEVQAELDTLTLQRVAVNQVLADSVTSARPEQRRDPLQSDLHPNEPPGKATATAQSARGLVRRRAAEIADSLRTAASDSARPAAAGGIAAGAATGNAASAVEIDVMAKDEATAPRLVASVTELRAEGVAFRRTYEVRPGIIVTLLDEPASSADTAGQRGADRFDRANPRELPAAAAAPVPPERPPMRAISWIERGRRYTLTGPLTERELEVLRARLR